jgi:cyclopropane fatty-acyl-phospholipid synthase-like methyltransferase
MSAPLSHRLLAIVDALPLTEGMRVLEVGCGPGAMARAIALRIGQGHVLGIDRSARAIGLAQRGAADLIASGRLAFRTSAVETFRLDPGEAPFDLAVAIRVGALDGRHPAAEPAALAALSAACRPGALLFTDPAGQLTTRPLPPPA